uniref:Putative cell wall hydrolase n=1 Tax=viral metagenome TaxID=1070528 RepID=A0A6M3LN21_9ZZZZ
MADQDIDLLSKFNFAESGSEKQAWVANTYVAFNRLNSGRYGDTLPEVLQGMSSAIKTNSKQWQLATGQQKRNEYEDNVMKEIIQTQYLIKTGKIENPIGNATHFENIEKFGVPYWAKKMKKIGKVGKHTYYEE